MATKPFWKSKTIWVNALAFASLFLQNAVGFDLGAEEQVGILAVINLFLRVVTKEGLSTS